MKIYKLLRQFGKISNIDVNLLKKAYNNGDWKQKTEMREKAELAIKSINDAKQS